ncbi:MAG: DUF4097 family beta strand repeat-containing protein [Acidimicrobiia bacterium]
MSSRLEQFAVGERFRVEATTTSGEITVRSGNPGEVVVRVDGPAADDYRISQHGDTISVVPERSGILRRFSATEVFLELPPGGSLSLTTASGDIVVQAETADLEATSASGDIRVGSVAGSGRIRSASGDISMDTVGGHLSVDTAAGDLRVGRVGSDLNASSAAGDIAVDFCGECVDVNTASGDITIRRVDGSDVRVKTMSGDVRLGIPPRRTLEVDLQTLSGDVRNRLPQGDGSPPEKRVALKVKTLSGDVTLQGV